jgi:hypothetical protein
MDDALQSPPPPNLITSQPQQMDSAHKLMQHIQAMQQQMHSRNTSQPPNGAVGQQSQFTTTAGRPPPPPPRQYASGKNFCDICNKDVCNKYFLRTHMLKMHGIVIDENKAVIGNINTLEREKSGALVFRCDICQLELPARSDLRSHKQSVHGVSPGPEPQVTNGGQTSTHALQTTPNKSASNEGGGTSGKAHALTCPVCSRQLDNATVLSVHLRAAHTGVVSEQLILAYERMAEMLAEKQRQGGAFKTETEQNHVNGKEDNDDDDNDQLMINEQRDDDDEQEMVDAPKATEGGDTAGGSLPPLIVQHNGAKLYRCSYCSYYTKWLSNLSVHERRHTGGEHQCALCVRIMIIPFAATPKDDKPFACTICLRAYRYAHSLERHRNVHKYSSLASQYASPEKNARLRMQLQLPNSSPKKTKTIDENQKGRRA